MADTDIISYQIKDFAGNTKSLPYYIPSGGTVAAAQALVNTTAPLLDAAIDGFIPKIHLTIALALPGGIKVAALAGNVVHEGALNQYDAAGTTYNYGSFVPSWSEAGFNGNDVLNTLLAAAQIADQLNYTDRYANALTAFIKGQRRFRK